MDDLQRTIDFNVKGNSYTLTFPTVGQLFQIEAMKVSVTLGTYGEMVKGITITILRTLDFVDMVAYLTILCPNLIKDLKVDSLTKLDIFDAKELVLEYRKQVVPWINKWQETLNDFKEEEQENTLTPIDETSNEKSTDDTSSEDKG